MTVITHSLSEKKQQKEPLVQADAAGQDVESGRTQTLVRLMRDRMQPVRERGALSSACVFLTAFLLFCAGMAACAYMYQQYQDYQVRRHFESCPFTDCLPNCRFSSAITGAGAGFRSRRS